MLVLMYECRACCTVRPVAVRLSFCVEFDCANLVLHGLRCMQIQSEINLPVTAIPASKAAHYHLLQALSLQPILCCHTLRAPSTHLHWLHLSYSMNSMIQHDLQLQLVTYVRFFRSFVHVSHRVQLPYVMCSQLVHITTTDKSQHPRA